MTITPLTHTDGSAGRDKVDARPIINPLKQLPAGEYNNLKHAVVDLQTEFNLLTGGTTVVDEDFAGAFRGTLTRTGVGAYAARRDEISASAPAVGDDAADGFLPGSIWVQIAGYPGPYDVPPVHTIWLCRNNNAGAAEWVEIREGAELSDAIPLAAGVAAAGVVSDCSRSDHVHPSSSAVVEEIAIKSGATVSVGDAVALVSGRVERSDARAGSVVAGYIGQCVAGGTGDAGGTVLARVVVGGIASAAGLTAGLPVYLSSTAIGVVTTTAPSGLGALSQIVGRALSATTFAMQVDAAVTIDWCSPLDVPTNGIFYGRADSSNVLSSGRVLSVADLFLTGRSLIQVSGGTAPLFVPNGGPGGGDAWLFDSSRPDKLRLAHDAGMTGLDWSGFAVAFSTNSSFGTMISKTTGGSPEPFDFALVGASEITLAGETAGGPTALGWRFDAFSRASTLTAQTWSRGANLVSPNAGALSNTNADIIVGDRASTNPFKGKMAAVALWARQISAAEQRGLAKWARREWAL